ncbi:unnamed protein product [Prorocentrum cordatum]|uniref:Uncharacterized protein n=1 Tax=Prorocentrum cordatum TaxID=2364126 RepID=A0ABN9VBJ4_9DINO|nr:unnamed protein product [Polarella glacialis]
MRRWPTRSAPADGPIFKSSAASLDELASQRRVPRELQLSGFSAHACLARGLNMPFPDSVRAWSGSSLVSPLSSSACHQHTCQIVSVVHGPSGSEKPPPCRRMTQRRAVVDYGVRAATSAR